jgi:hypothetical protein
MGWKTFLQIWLKTKVDVFALLFNIDNIPDTLSYSGITCAKEIMSRKRTMPE